MEKLAIGTAQFGMCYGIANQNGQVKENEIKDILDLAWENGLNTLDTAKAYGNSEESIGSYLKKHSENSWAIITKVSDGKNSLYEQFQDSIEKLSVPPNALLAHSAELFIDGVFQKQLKKLKEQQVIRSIGVSLYNECQINQVLKSGLIPEIIQLPLNILDTRLYHHGTLAQLAEKGIEIHARSAFLQGLFYLPDSEIKERFVDVVPFMEKLKFIASEAGLTLPELSLLWLIHLEEVSKLVIGVENIKQLKAHLETLEKNVDPVVFEEALSVNYENENILNPSLWL